MTKTRFTMNGNIIAVKDYSSGFYDSKKCAFNNIHGRLTYQELADTLNSLSNENDHLKNRISIYEAFIRGNDLDIEWEEFCVADECIKESEKDDFDCKDCYYIGSFEEVCKR